MLSTLEKIRDFLSGGEIGKFHRDQDRRRRKALLKIAITPPQALQRFSKGTLLSLLDAGWRNNRNWASSELNKFKSKIDWKYPDKPQEILNEFGGLSIGFTRTIDIGFIEDSLLVSLEVISDLVGLQLYPIGRTNLIEDDGLGVFCDEQGRIYVDGATGFEVPRDYRIDYLAVSFEEALNCLFSNKPTKFPKPDADEATSWYYSLPDPN